MLKCKMYLVALCSAVAWSSVSAQPAPAMPTAKRIAAPAEPDAIPLYTGAAPGSENARQKEVWSYLWDQRVVRNVTHPTLTPVLPDPAKANGTAVIVIPGGGFLFGSMDNEGWPIAKWLADRGVAAFILKYRLEETPDAEPAFTTALMARFAAGANANDEARKLSGIRFAMADAQTALKRVRAGSVKWHINPNRVGLLGFSAGAMTTLGVTLANDPAARADFIAPIYGPMGAVVPPENAPPMFTALAADDGFFGGQGFGLVESWQKAKRPVELHFYEGGGHGFGSFKKGTTSDNWFLHYMAWLEARGLLKSEK